MDGGGFKFYELTSSLIVKDVYGNDVISKKYNTDMVAEAMCKIMGITSQTGTYSGNRAMVGKELYFHDYISNK